MANCIKPGGSTLAMSQDIIVAEKLLAENKKAVKGKKAVEVNYGVFKFYSNAAGYSPQPSTLNPKP